MDREKALELLRGGADRVKEWNRLRGDSEEIPDLSDAHLIGAELNGADLSGADLTGANLDSAVLTATDLNGVNLSGASLIAADLSGANISGANLGGANLLRADLSDADLSDADLSCADLRDANLGGANLRRANLRNANLRRARVGWTTFATADLSSTEGLETLRHSGPSSIGLDTLQTSGEVITDRFLTGSGVTDDWLTYIRPMLQMGSPIKLYSCFISYSHQDEEFTERLYSRMRQDSLRVWYAPEDMKAGRKIHEQIDSAIRLHDKLLVVLSEHSMQSEWVANEIREAFKREKQEGRRVLFPISLAPFKQIENWKLIDSRTGTDLAEEIRQYFIPDFTNWKDHDAFEATYQRLMKYFQPAPDDK